MHNCIGTALGPLSAVTAASNKSWPAAVVVVVLEKWYVVIIIIIGQLVVSQPIGIIIVSSTLMVIPHHAIVTVAGKGVEVVAIIITMFTMVPIPPESWLL